MDEFGLIVMVVVLGGVLALSGPIAFGIVLGLRGRIAALEARQVVLEQWASRRPSDASERPASAAPASPVPPRPMPEIAAIEPIVEADTPTEPAQAPAPPPPPLPSAAPKPSFEERFGTRWVVWIGGIALAFGAVLLMRYSIEQGVFGPGMRTLSGLAVAFGLIGAGEVLRRRLRGAAPTPPRWPDIPAMVTAAGIVALFGAIYAAHALYGFLGPEVAFLLLGATGLAAMVAAGLHGPALAGIGLIGAMITPLLVGKPQGSLWPVALYLSFVAASAYGFAWLKGWRALGLAAWGGAALWSLLLALRTDTPGAEAAPVLAHAVIQAALAAFTLAVLPHRGEPDAQAWPDRVGSLVLATIAGVLGTVLAFAVSADGNSAIWIATGLAAVAIPALAAFRTPAAAPGLLTAALSLGALVLLWPEIDPSIEVAFPLWRDVRDPNLFLWTTLLAALAVTALGTLRLLGGGRLPAVTAGLYAAGATLTPLAVLSLAYLRIAHAEVSPGFAALAGLLGLCMTGLAARFRQQVEHTPSAALTLGLGSFASAAVAAIALGLVFGLAGGSLTLAFALAALATASIARHLDLPALRWCVAGLGLVVAGRLAWDPAIVGTDLGTRPVFNWLLIGYGVPALAFGLAARTIRLPARAPDAPVLIAEGLSVLFAALLVFFELRHGLNDGDILAPTSGFLEQGLMTLSALGFSAILVRLDSVHGSPVLRAASLGFGILALAQGLVGLAILTNPGFTDEPVTGGRVLNTVTLAYGLPALAALWMAHAAGATRPAWYVRCAQVTGLAIGFIGLCLAVRRGFQGPEIGFDRMTGDAEWYAYSAAWLLLGLAALAYGILRGSLTARLASAALVGLSILKVFLLDLSSLDGPLRALSFLGLGAVLIVIGLVYQRYVFAPRRGQAPDPVGLPGA